MFDCFALRCLCYYCLCSCDYLSWLFDIRLNLFCLIHVSCLLLYFDVMLFGVVGFDVGFVYEFVFSVYLIVCLCIIDFAWL